MEDLLEEDRSRLRSNACRVTLDRVHAELNRRCISRSASLLKVPYRTVLGGAVLDLTLVVRFPQGRRKGEPLEVLFDAYDLRRGGSSALGELTLLQWHASRPGTKLAKDTVGQPLGVWIYGDGAAVAACLEDEVPRKSLKRWLELSRQRPDPSLRGRVSLATREPRVDRADRPRGRLPQGAVVRVLQPESIIYPFGGGGDGSENDGEEQPAHAPHTAAPARRKRPYLDECEGMDFGGLRAFIDDSLDALAVRALGPPGRPGARPSSGKEFRALLGMLRGKIGNFPVGPAVSDPGPAPERRFRPSEELLLARADRDRLRAALRRAEGCRGQENEREAKVLMRALHFAERRMFSMGPGKGRHTRTLCTPTRRQGPPTRQTGADAEQRTGSARSGCACGGGSQRTCRAGSGERSAQAASRPRGASLGRCYPPASAPAGKSSLTMRLYAAKNQTRGTNRSG